MPQLLIPFLLICLWSPLGAQDLIETVIAELPDASLVEGDLDWTNNSLLVYGEGSAPESVTDPVRRRLLGFRAAKVAAYRNLMEVVGQVHVDSRTTVSMTMVSSDDVRMRVEGLVKGARVMANTRQEEAGLYRIAVGLDLLGEMADAVLPPTVSGEYPDLSLDPASDLPDALPQADSFLVFVPSKPFTGLIVDARGLDLRPAMSPRIIDDRDRVIYSADHVPREYAIEFGVAGYDKSVTRAATSDRFGGTDAHPMVVQCEGAAGLYNSDAVVSRDTGIRILMANTESGFLDQCRVVFLVGPRPDPELSAAASDTVDALLELLSDPDGEMVPGAVDSSLYDLR